MLKKTMNIKTELDVLWPIYFSSLDHDIFFVKDIYRFPIKIWK